MSDGIDFCVFFSSRSIGGYKGRKGLWPECHACDKALGLKGKDNTTSVLVPPEAMPLVFTAKQAAQEMGIKLQIVDVNKLAFFKRLKFKLQGITLPCVKIGEEYIFGNLSKDEIIRIYSNLQSDIETIQDTETLTSRILKDMAHTGLEDGASSGFLGVRRER